MLCNVQSIENNAMANAIADRNDPLKFDSFANVETASNASTAVYLSNAIVSQQYVQNHSECVQIWPIYGSKRSFSRNNKKVMRNCLENILCED